MTLLLLLYVHDSISDSIDWLPNAWCKCILLVAALQNYMQFSKRSLRFE